MKIESFKTLVAPSPMIASVQASPKSPLEHEDTLLRLARASVQSGVKFLRLEGVKAIRTIKPALSVPIIGLLKRQYPGSDVYITPAAQDVDALIDLGCDVVAIDGSQRERPKKNTVEALIARIHRRNTLAMADCDCLESAIAAEAAGTDIIGTTLAGYTDARAMTDGPDFELLREILRTVKVPVIAEGRFSQRWEVETALRMGATAVVVGGALNDPVKQTRALTPNIIPPRDRNAKIGAVDIGGTWLRFATFTTNWELEEVVRVPNPKSKVACIQWIKEQLELNSVSRVGVSTGGIVDPKTGEVWTAKEYLMPDHTGIVFSEEALGVPTFAFGDGHATAWGHACLPAYAGLRVATLALGTGVGAGFVDRNKIWAGRRGEYPRINDLPAAGGGSYEDLLGGINLTTSPTAEQQDKSVKALEGAVQALRDLYFPDVLVVGGSVGLSPWLKPHLDRLGAVPSPFEGEAGLYGAAALALFPDWR